ncbi:MAG: hypothetical protein ACO3JL_08265 [Myxococcota bacterium]
MRLGLSRWYCILLTLAVATSTHAQGVVRDREPPTISHEELRTGLVGEPLRIVAVLRDPAGVFEPTVFYRLAGEQEFLRLPMKRTSERYTYEAVIEGPLVTGEVEYFIEVFDRFGNGPARYGDAELPMRVRIRPVAAVEAEPPGPGAGPTAAAGTAVDTANEDAASGSPLPWVLLGVGVATVAVGAGVAAVVILAPATSPSTVTVSVSAPGPMSTSVSP